MAEEYLIGVGACQLNGLTVAAAYDRVNESK